MGRAPEEHKSPALVREVASSGHGGLLVGCRALEISFFIDLCGDDSGSVIEWGRRFESGSRLLASLSRARSSRVCIGLSCEVQSSSVVK